MRDYQLPDIFPHQKDILQSISFVPSMIRSFVDTRPNAGSITLATDRIEVRDPDKWEDVGRVAGFTTAAIIYSLTAPVVLTDGPLPFVDAAWVWAGLRFSKSGSDLGASIGEAIDDILIPAFS